MTFRTRRAPELAEQIMTGVKDLAVLESLSQLHTVGKRVPRSDAREKVTGRAQFTADIHLPRMLHGALVPSPLPKGRIRRIDASEAFRLPGVHAVITASDLTDPRGAIRCPDIRYGVVLRDRPILADGEVRFVGEPVAAVAAVDPRTAREAAARVRVEVEPEPAVLDLEEAIRPDAPRVHRASYEPQGGTFLGKIRFEAGRSNICYTAENVKGDVDRAFRQCVRIFEDTFTFPSVYHYAMEPYCIVAMEADHGLTVWSSAQHPYQVQRDLARLFGVPISHVRLIVPYVGGGFGSKSFTHLEPIAVALARATGRPVKLELNVAEAAMVSRRHGSLARIRSGVDAQGRILAFEAEMYLDTGAYTLLGPQVAMRVTYRGLGGYEIPHYRLRGHCVYVNRSPAGSFRAVGGPQSAWGLETHLNRVAAALGEDPISFRRRHVAAKGAVFRPGRTPMDANLQEDLDRLEELLAASPLEDPAFDGITPWRVGTGVALGVTDPGASPISSAIVRLSSDGSVTVAVGSTELGQGVRTVVAQIAAETLDLPLERIAVLRTDTSYGPFDTSTGSSRSTTISGLAVQRAAAEVRRRVEQAAAELWEVPPDRIRIDQGRVWVEGTGDSRPMGELVSEYFGGAGNFIGCGEVSRREFPQSPIFWEVAAGAARIAVDVETGRIRVLAYYTVGDLGRVINPLLMEGQEEGAAVQGMGHTLWEALAWQDGQLLNNSLVVYKVPRFSDIPVLFRSAFVEGGEGPGPFGAKGGGEGALVPVAGAVAGGLFAATGVWIRDLPLVPERVWSALVSAGIGEDFSASSTADAPGSAAGGD